MTLVRRGVIVSHARNRVVVVVMENLILKIKKEKICINRSKKDKEKQNRKTVITFVDTRRNKRICSRRRSKSV